VNGGTLASSGDAEFTVEGNDSKINNFTLTGHIAIRPRSVLSTASLKVNNVVLSDGIMRLHGIAQPNASNASIITDAAQTISGAGTIIFDGTGWSSVLGIGNGSLTLGAGVSVVTGSGGGYVIGDGQQLVNHGFIAAQTSNLLFIETNLTTNLGTITATNGGTLALSGNWTNSGTLHLAGGTMQLGGTFTASSLGGLSGAGGTINLLASLNNTGNTLSISHHTLRLIGSEITGGTVSTSATGAILGVGSTSTIGQRSYTGGTPGYSRWRDHQRR
jgi:hypothetical protein